MIRLLIYVLLLLALARCDVMVDLPDQWPECTASERIEGADNINVTCKEKLP